MCIDKATYLHHLHNLIVVFEPGSGEEHVQSDISLNEIQVSEVCI